MAQEDNKMRPDLSNRGNDDKSGKKTPRFSIYWIYGLIAVILIGYQLLNYGTADSRSISSLEFQQNMLSKGDVAKLDLIINKQTVRIYIINDSLRAHDYYRKFADISTDPNIKGPLF